MVVVMDVKRVAQMATSRVEMMVDKMGTLMVELLVVEKASS